MWEFVNKNKYIILAIVVVVIFGLIYYKHSENMTISSGDSDPDAGMCRDSCSYCKKNCPFKRYNGTCECSYCDSNKCAFG